MRFDPSILFWPAPGSQPAHQGLEKMHESFGRQAGGCCLPARRSTRRTALRASGEWNWRVVLSSAGRWRGHRSLFFTARPRMGTAPSLAPVYSAGRAGQGHHRWLLKLNVRLGLRSWARRLPGRGGQTHRLGLHYYLTNANAKHPPEARRDSECTRGGRSWRILGLLFCTTPRRSRDKLHGRFPGPLALLV